jgi:16S rRNA (cytosine1402-N4)-methyltransferase
MAQTPDERASMPYHHPVMVREILDLLVPVERGVLVDATFGGGGHTRAILERLPEINVLALDRDPDAAAQVLADPRLRFAAANFGDLDRTLAAEIGTEVPPHELGEDDHPSGGVAAVLFDLGVSSHQLDTRARGFSYRDAGPLDMRMGPDARRDADEIVNEWDARQLARILSRFGEERFAVRIARAVVAARPIRDTAQLAEVVASAVPAAARRHRHPARKTFQAIRIAVNDELEALERGLDAAIRWVRPRGRIVVITYHSLEDRIVKRRFAAGSAGCECPPNLPVCACGRVTELRSLARKVVRPAEDEVASNPRSRSAKLRAVEKVAS